MSRDLERNGSLLNVLMVEDSPTDADLAVEALATAKIRVNMSIVTDGEAAMAFLCKQAPYEGAPDVDLVLLDLNLPKLSGFEVLERMRADETMTLIPVVILTTSEDEHDILNAYKLRGNAYVTKPVDFEQFARVVRLMDEFWFEAVKLPSKANAVNTPEY